MNNTTPLKKNYEFLRVYKKGKFYVGKYLVLYVLKKRNQTENRLGISVSKKVGKSVTRNRLKRLVKESYRAYEERIHTGNDIVFVARHTEKIPGYSEIRREMKYLLNKLGIFIKNNE
jgi:ribonuclease P protein component